MLRLSGRVSGDHLEELQKQLQQREAPASLDLEEVSLVDAEVVRFFVDLEREGIAISNASSYIREWMKRVREKQP